MATLALGLAGGAIGGAVLPGINLFGSTLTGAAIGQAVGASVGAIIDESLFSSSGQSRVVEGPRLSDLQVMASNEGAPIPRIYGRVRLSGQVIWATRLEEEVVTTNEARGSGKGLASGSAQQTTTRVEYNYYANFAVGLCEGEIARIGRVWADGKELNLASYVYRLYRGTSQQLADSLISATEGSENTPAFRDLAYIVFERMALARFGNRIPQLSFEIFRPLDDFEQKVRAISIIPSSGEFAYEPEQILRDEGNGESTPENVHTNAGGSDWRVAIDQLTASLPNVATTSLVVGWFGNDLRAGQCEIRPKVENSTKSTTPESWQVAGVTRSQAQIVSQVDGRPAYGGSPSDASVVAAIKDLNGRGLRVTFYPFILMDIPQTNSLPDPYGGASQSAYPWRGRISVYPAPGQSGSPDKTAAAATEVSQFVGTAQPSDFSILGESVLYSGPNEWSFRRFILHYAQLCKAAGGVDSFLIASEMRGLSWVRSAAGTYPFVAALVQLASDVKSILGSGTMVSYAADWSEFFGHQPQDASGDVYFHLDPLWASSDIDAVGIDTYWPLSDWRDGSGHADRISGVESIYDRDYLRGNVAGGEGYDWYYASEADRENQVRTPITDGQGKPWVFRYKDIKSWWQNLHFDRPGGTEGPTPTAWIPQSKPIWLTELGCPAVDKGANQPNVFFDPKSAESQLPYFSRGARDDLMQRRYIEAVHDFFDPAHEDYIAGSNPTSAVYGDRMVALDRLYVYTWDARPYPAFPFALDVWSDGGNWELGHWLTGRLGSVDLARLVAVMLEEQGFLAYDSSQLTGTVDGFVLDRIMSAREALQPLELAYFFDTIESGGKIAFRHRGRSAVRSILTRDQLVDAKSGEFEVRRKQETELPQSVRLRYIDGDIAYRQASVEARHTGGYSAHTGATTLPIVMPPTRAQSSAEIWLRDSWAGREALQFALPPSQLALEPTDLVALDTGVQTRSFRLTAGEFGAHQRFEAIGIDAEIYERTATPARKPAIELPRVFGKPNAVFLDLPLLSGGERPAAGYVAAYLSPWPGGVGFYRSPESNNYQLNAVASAAATVGETLSDLPAGPTSRWDYANGLDVRIYGGGAGNIAAASDLATLAGANLAAIERANGQWEVVQFRNVELTGQGQYRLSKLLRGQAGTEHSDAIPSGARFVLLDASLAQTAMTSDEVGLLFNWTYGPVNRSLGDPSYGTTSFAFEGVGLRPLSPVHIRAQRDGSGAIDISWIRRTRVGGDNWNGLDVPLGEESEAYEIDIFDAGTVRRTLFSSIPNATYSVSDQMTDWGGLQASVDIKVYQISAVYGRGKAGSANV